MGWLEDAVERVREFAYAERPPSHDPAKPPKIGLALGGGFARGVAHIGVLHTLQQHQIPIDFIAGTSAGALAGIAFAAGIPFEETVKKAENLRFGAFGHWSFSRMGLASNQRLEFYPERFLGVNTFEELKIPLTITSTDLATGESVYFREGHLGPALRASCAYPGLFRPVEHEGRLLVDGFVSATVPVEAARLMGAELVIAVFLDAESAEQPMSMIDVIGRSFAIVQRQADTRWRATSNVIIAPEVRHFAWDDFARTPELVAAGEAAAVAALPQIAAALQASREQDAFDWAPPKRN